jgi:membrane protein implicated in regulation of membrane protease activity
MLWSIAAAFIALWLLGLITSNLIGGFIHVLIVIAAILIVWSLFQRMKKRQFRHLALPRNPRAYRHITERGNLFV